MKLTKIIDFFIHPSYFEKIITLNKAQLFIRGCLLTACFSSSYIVLSSFFDFKKGVYFMIFNVIGFLTIAFLTKTKIPLNWLGNTYMLIGSTAIVVLTYYSGGIWSAVYPWIISIPVLALLVVNKKSGVVWGALSLIAMLWYGYLAINGIELPKEYNQNLHTEWFVSISPGLLMIVFFISYVFEHNQTKAVEAYLQRNEELETQKQIVAEQSDQLKQLLDDKNFIIRIMAHDLRNPLKNIESLAGMAKTEKNESLKSECIDLISKSSKNALNLVNKVLKMDAMEQDGMDLKLEKLDVRSVLSDSIESLKKSADEKGIFLQLENIAKNTQVDSDKTYLPLIFENLLSNAIKFSPKDTKVIAQISNSNSTIQIKIMDEGPGVAPEDEEKLFTKFSKLSAMPTGGESSTGLGLALVKRYTSMINGKIWYEHGRGATFIVELPQKSQG